MKFQKFPLQTPPPLFLGFALVLGFTQFDLGFTQFDLGFTQFRPPNFWSIVAPLQVGEELIPFDRKQNFQISTNSSVDNQTRFEKKKDKKKKNTFANNKYLNGINMN